LGERNRAGNNSRTVLKSPIKNTALLGAVSGKNAEYTGNEKKK